MHLALFYGSETEYIQGVLNFAKPAIRAGEPVAVAVPGAKVSLLERHLRQAGAQPEIFDMVELGRNPARIIPAVESMLAHHSGALLHYVGEPIWPGRSPEEIQEATRHEALINLAWPGTQIRVLCPYDVRALPDAVLEDAQRTHPHLITGGQTAPSPLYHGPSVPLGSEHPLPDPPANAASLAFGLQELSSVRTLVSARAMMAGMAPDRVNDLVLAVNELATNTIRHGGGRGILRVWRAASRLVCQIEDSGHIADPLAGRRVPRPEVAGGVGLWTVNQLCELVEIRSGSGGTTIRVHAALEG
ncbi:MAG TPA: sensor histidine kinase [Solirubrobacteraceae bacterium]|nr:sensor histidine kinase [Solirubrobacteraceae bacterium]